MSSFSVWHGLVVLFFFGLPLYFIFKDPPAGPNRFGELPPSVNFAEATTRFFGNCTNFSGRASRSEYWYSVLLNIVVSVVLHTLDTNGFPTILWGLFSFLAMLAVGSRRLHDINRSGWFQLLSFCVPIGTIVVLVWHCTRARDTAVVLGRPIARPASAGAVDVLERLARLKASGALTPEEFDIEKRKILGQ